MDLPNRLLDQKDSHSKKPVPLPRTKILSPMELTPGIPSVVIENNIQVSPSYSFVSDVEVGGNPEDINPVPSTSCVNNFTPCCENHCEPLATEFANAIENAYDVLKAQEDLNATNSSTDLNSQEDFTVRNISCGSPPVFSIQEEEELNRSTISEFDPLHGRDASVNFIGVSNKHILETIVIEDTIIGEDTPNKPNKQLCVRQESIASHEFEDDVIIISDSPIVTQRDDIMGCDIPEQSVECTSQRPPLPGSFISLTDSVVSNPDNSVQAMEASKSPIIQCKISTLSKFKKMFGIFSEPGLKLLVGPAIEINGPNFYGALNWIPDDHIVSLSKSCFCSLIHRKLCCYTDSVTQILREEYKLNNLTSVQMLLASNCNSLYCFELGLLNTNNPSVEHNSRLKVTFGCKTAAEQLLWIQNIVMNLTTKFLFVNYSEFSRLGWCYLKEGVSGNWVPAWLLLTGRVLQYTSYDKAPEKVDLRKTIYLGTEGADEDSRKACPSDCPNLFLSSSDNTLYLRFPHVEEFQNWKSIITIAAHNNGLRIDEQQLTNDDVPAIVDKCIQFIYAYGILSEGIYRRAGSSVILTDLLMRFRADAWSVQLTPQFCSEHDVAGVLKRFLRDLPTPLISRKCHDILINALEIYNECRRLERYQSAVDELCPVSFKTARKLFGHLHFVQKYSETNKMNAENLAVVWAPTIMLPSVTTTGEQTSWLEKEVTIVREIIVNYETVWRPDEGELERDRACYRVVSRMQECARQLPQPTSAGDLRFWIWMADAANHYQVTLTPTKTCADVCKELGANAHILHNTLMMEEQICNGAMTRIVHMDEIVLDVVTRWAYWDYEDSKNNNLVIKDNTMLQQLKKTYSRLIIDENINKVCGQLRYASDDSKKFKSYIFEVDSSMLTCYADSQGSTKVAEWDMKNTIWYFGHEEKRDPLSRWAITFIPKNKNRRSKERPYFGCTIAGGMDQSKLRWAAALMFAQHNRILPSEDDLL